MATWLDKFIGHIIQAAGIALTQRQYLNFIGATVADNPATGATDVTIGGQGIPLMVTKSVTAGDVVLTPAEALADVLIITGSPGVSRAVTYPTVASGFVPRPDGTRLLVANLSNAQASVVDPWVNTGVYTANLIGESVWFTSSSSISQPMFTGGIQAALDSAFGTTRGTILYRAAGGWAALAMGTTGQVLTATTGGDPHWA